MTTGGNNNRRKIEIYNSKKVGDKVDIQSLQSPETIAIKESYPPVEGLEAGDTGSWLQQRYDQLLSKAEDNRNNVDILKAANGGLLVLGLAAMSSSPLVPIGVAIAGLGYGWQLLCDMRVTHKLCPVPFVREGIFDLFSRLGSADARHNHQADEYKSLIAYLSPFELAEIDMLATSLDLVADFLVAIPTGKRFYGYRYILRRYTLTRGCLIGEQELMEHVAQVQMDATLDYEYLDVVSEYQNQSPNQLQQQQQIPRRISATTKIVDQSTPNSENASYEMDLQNPAGSLQTSLSPTVNSKSVSWNDSNEMDLRNPSGSNLATTTTSTANLNFVEIKNLPLTERCDYVLDLIESSGFHVTKITNAQIMAVCGNQRGGKTTLMGFIAILMMAEAPSTKLYYFTVGRDIYPVKTTKHISAINYDDDDILASEKAAKAIYKFFRQLENSKPGSLKDVVIMVDEVAGVLKYLTPEEKAWLLEYWLRAIAKTGASIYLALHATNLMALSGKNTGWANQFRDGVSWIGCKAENVLASSSSRLRPELRATGEYFVTDPDNFNSVADHLGEVPDWLKVAKNPATGHPCVIRTLLALFPEFHMAVEDIAKLDSSNSGSNGIDMVAEITSLLAPKVEVREDTRTNQMDLVNPSGSDSEFEDVEENFDDPDFTADDLGISEEAFRILLVVRQHNQRKNNPMFTKEIYQRKPFGRESEKNKSAYIQPLIDELMEAGYLNVINGGYMY